jgi:zinc protease
MESRKSSPSHAENAGASTPHTALDEGTRRFTLANGLEVIVHEDHFAPVVALQAWVKVGGADEHDREAGVAHVHEHMLFKGTKNRGVGQIAAEVESSGGHINAFTTPDHTVYHIVLAAPHFATGLDILADALRNSTFDATELARELGVVMEEWKRSEDMPVSRGYTELFRQAFRQHPYGRPVIGWRETIEALDRPQVLDFFRRWYLPNNTVLVVVGDFDGASVRAEIQKAFGSWKRGKLPRRARPREPQPTSPRLATIEMPVQEHQLLLGFPIPSTHDPDVVPLDLLAYVLAGGESTRLVHSLEAEKELVNSISGFAYTPSDPGLFVVLASLERKKIGGATEEILAQIERVRRELVTPAELARARGNLESEFVYRKETVQGRARLLGYSQCVFEDARYEHRYLAGLATATREDIRRVAATHLDPRRLTSVLVGPDAARLLPKSALNGSSRARVRPPAKTPASRATGRSVGRPARRDPAIHTRTLPNGVRLIVKQHRGAPLLAIRAATLGGLLLERPEIAGISNFLAGMVTRGTTYHSRAMLGRSIESLAGFLEGFSGRNSFGIRGQFLSQHVEEGSDLVLEVLRSPTFPDDEVEKRRRELLVQLANRDDEPAQRAIELFYEEHFPAHPYGLPVIGRKKSLKNLTRRHLVDYHQRLLAPERLVVSAVGDVDPAWLLGRLEAGLAALPRVTPLPHPRPAARLTHIKRVTQTLDRQQAHFVLGVRGGRIADPDRAALKMIEAILSRQGGRLFLELRDRQGLAYSVSAFASEGVDPGVFGVYFACAPDVVERAVSGVLAELGRLRDEPVGRAELEEARRYLLGSYDISLQTNAAQADELVFNELYGLGLDGGTRYREAVAAVTPASIQAAARGYLTLDAYTLAIVGPRRSPK